MDAFVKVRVDSVDKEIASSVLKELGLNLSDLIRMVIVKTAKTKKIPFEIGLSAESRQAIKEVEQGKAMRLTKMADLDLPRTPPSLSTASQ